jgi:hypothetical protein
MVKPLKDCLARRLGAIARFCSGFCALRGWPAVCFVLFSKSFAAGRAQKHAGRRLTFSAAFLCLPLPSFAFRRLPPPSGQTHFKQKPIPTKYMDW